MKHITIHDLLVHNERIIRLMALEMVRDMGQIDTRQVTFQDALSHPVRVVRAQAEAIRLEIEVASKKYYRPMGEWAMVSRRFMTVG